MDSDLQDPPAISLQLVDQWQEGGEVVYAQRRTRQDTWFKKITAFWYYRLLRAVTQVDIPPDTGDFRLLDHKVVAALRLYPETNKFWRGLIAGVGFNQVAVPFDRHGRFAGQTKYPLRRMLKFAVDGIMSFSNLFLHYILYMGIIVATISFLGIIYAAIIRIFFPASAVSGWAFLSTIIFFMGGVQMLSLGILGEYIGRIFSEVKHRPPYIVSTTLNLD
jgi:dolichol-phosphate mannosyltransferase